MFRVVPLVCCGDLGGGAKILALSAPEHDDTDYANWATFFLAVAQRSRKHGYEVLLLMNAHQTEELMRISDSGLIDGVLLLDVELDDERVELARKLLVPVVAIGIPDDTGNVYAIDLDFERMGREAVEIAYRLGHRHLLHFGGVSKVYERGSNFMIRTRDAVQRTAKRLGMTVTFVPAEGYDLDTTQRQIDEAFRRDRHISAVFGQSNMPHLNNMQAALSRRGLRIPDDISMMALATFGNAENLVCPLDEMPMQPFATCGRAVDVMADVLGGRDLASGVVELVPTKWIRRGSMRSVV